MDRLSMDKVSACSECEYLIQDGNVNRCGHYDNAVIDDINEKHCKDSVR